MKRYLIPLYRAIRPSSAAHIKARARRELREMTNLLIWSGVIIWRV